MTDDNEFPMVLPPEFPHVITSRTRRQVQAAAALGLDESQIAHLMDCTPLQLRSYYPNELTYGMAVVTAKVGSALLKQCMKGDINAIKFFLKARAKWIEPTKVELTGKDGQAIEVNLRGKRELISKISGMLNADKKHFEESKATAKANPGAQRIN